MRNATALPWPDKGAPVKPKPMKKLSLLTISTLLILSTVSCAQSLKLVRKSNPHHRVYRLEKAATAEEPLTFPDSFTAVTLESPDTSAPFADVVVTVNENPVAVKPSAHPAEALSGTRSEMIMMASRTDQLKLTAPEKALPLTIHLLDARAQGQQPAPRSKKPKTYCQKPPTIDQTDWRSGLPEPDYEPIKQEVRHLIVHHSAANSGNANTRELIRNIYLYHTNVNGWSDIGYNFVIGVNGRIYQGRDGLGQVPDHRVKGAHFCGKNSRTMGVALIGNYEEASPPRAAVQSLQHLLTWKGTMADLDPAAYYQHPPYADSPDFLGVVAGHQDGCATLCPGANLYQQLPTIKQTVSDSVSQCPASITGYTAQQAGQSPAMRVQVDGGQIQVHLSRPSSGQLSLYNLQGQPVSHSLRVNQRQQAYQWNIPNLNARDLYIVRFRNQNGQAKSRKIQLP